MEEYCMKLKKETDKSTEAILLNNEDDIEIHNAIIQAYSKLSAEAQKILFYALTYVKNKPINEIDDPITFSVRELLKKTQCRDASGQDYRKVKKALIQLRDSSITPYGNDDNEESFLSFSITSEVEFNKELNIFHLALNRRFAYYLFGTDGRRRKPYTIMLLKYYMLLKTINAMKIYALLYSRYKMTINRRNSNIKNGNELSVPIKLETFRNMLFGKGSDKYQDFKIFNQRILSIALNEINELTDMRVSIDRMIRENRKVSTIVFNICLNTAESLELFDMQRLYTRMYKIANDISKAFTEADIAEYKNTFGEYFFNKLNLVYTDKRIKAYPDITEATNLVMENYTSQNYCRTCDADAGNDTLVESKINSLLNAVTKDKKKQTAKLIRSIAIKYRQDNYIEFLNAWKFPVDESVYKKLEEIATEKDKYHSEIKSFAIENRKERLSSQTDEAKLVEAIAVANQKEKELKNTFHNMFINE